MMGKWILGMGVLLISLGLILGTVLAAEKPIKLGVVFIMFYRDTSHF